MPRIIVTTDNPEQRGRASVLLDELVQSVHLSTGHAASQLIERLAWAISDAEDAERVRSDRTTRVVGRTGAQVPASPRRPARPRHGRPALAA
jgi:hypothetical protein